MDTSAWIGIAGLVIALLAAAGTVASAIITRTAVHGAQRDAGDARSIAEQAVAETKRIADAAEERVRLDREQIEEERERAKPNVTVRVLDAWVAGQGAGTADMRIRVTVHNVARLPDVLTEITVGFGTTIYRLPPGVPAVQCDDPDGKTVRIPLHLESDKPVELTLRFSPAMGGHVERGWESPAAIECHFEHAPARRVGATVRVP